MAWKKCTAISVVCAGDRTWTCVRFLRHMAIIGLYGWAAWAQTLFRKIQWIPQSKAAPLRPPLSGSRIRFRLWILNTFRCSVQIGNTIIQKMERLSQGKKTLVSYVVDISSRTCLTNGAERRGPRCRFCRGTPQELFPWLVATWCGCVSREPRRAGRAVIAPTRRQSQHGLRRKRRWRSSSVRSWCLFLCLLLARRYRRIPSTSLHQPLDFVEASVRLAAEHINNLIQVPISLSEFILNPIERYPNPIQINQMKHQSNWTKWTICASSAKDFKTQKCNPLEQNIQGRIS